MKITDWALQERPRERMMLQGVSALSDAELLAILIRSGTREMTALDVARFVLNAHENQLQLLARAPVVVLNKVKGIGKAKAAALCAAFELGRRAQAAITPGVPITSAQQVAALMGPLLRDLTHETCWVLFLDGGRHLIGKEQMSSGGINATLVDVRMVLKAALDKLSCEIILVHNHPSGNDKPGRQDKNLTASLREAAQLVDVRLIDHVVIGGNSYFSFAEEGLL